MLDLAYGPWTWLVAGLLLVGLEVLAPGVFLVWLGLAALLTGLADYALGLSWQTAALVFAGLAILCVLAGRAVMKRAPEMPGMLNRRGELLVGRSFALDAPVVAGEGRVRVDDSVWRVVGPDLPVGASVTVTRLDGNTLVVSPTAPSGDRPV
jgi:membrane protein implicated in regulation of membrane protease activity